jgi:hypothetical protein
VGAPDGGGEAKLLPGPTPVDPGSREEAAPREGGAGEGSAEIVSLDRFRRK